MNHFVARIAYWKSLGFDNSDGPVAGMRQKEREQRLKRRIGAKAYRQFDGNDSGAIRDPAFYASILISLSIYTAIGAAIFLFIFR